MTSSPLFKRVPVEPTDEMYLAALRDTRDPGYGHCHDAIGGAVYRAMLAAAPEPPADEIETLRERVKELEAARDKAIAALKWTDEVYPARISAGGAGVEITWDEFNAMREVAGFRPVKRIGDEEGRSGFNHRLRMRLRDAESRPRAKVSG